MDHLRIAKLPENAGEKDNFNSLKTSWSCALNSTPFISGNSNSNLKLPKSWLYKPSLTVYEVSKYLQLHEGSITTRRKIKWKECYNVVMPMILPTTTKNRNSKSNR